MAMEQRQRTTTVLVRSKLKVKFPFEGGSVDVRKPAQKLIWSGILFHVWFKFLTTTDVDFVYRSLA